MENNKREQFLLFLSIIGFFIMSAAILLVPFSDVIGSWVPGALFWLFLITAVTGQIMLQRCRRKWLVQYRVKDQKFIKGFVGIASFFKNVPAIIADCLMFCSIIATVIAFILTNGTGYACYVTLALVMFSFSMHCIFNGKIYYYVVNHGLVVKKHKTSSFQKGVNGNERKK